MHVNSYDFKPTSLLDAPTVNGRMWLGGVLAVLGAHVIVPFAVLGALTTLAATGLASTEPETYVDDKIVEAHFVKLGQKLDPKKLPNRKVPIKSTAHDDATAISKINEPPPPEKPDAGPRPDRPEEDPLMRLGDRAQAFAEIAERREQEGDPEGVEWGTEDEARAGDLYAGQLSSFFKRGWTVPTTLGDTSKFATRVSIEITRDLKIGGFEIVKGSGEPVYDQSVKDRLNDLMTLQTTLPEPPPEVADQYLGRKIDFNFKDIAR
jgi:hypothetical protein